MISATRPRWADWCAFLIPLSIYSWTAAPGVTLIDSGEFAMAGPTLGIPHPPGVPTYILLGYLFSLVHVSASIARRMNLFSSFAAAGAVWIAYRLTCELVEDIDPRTALAGALAFGFSLSLWHWAVITEVYALNILFIAIVYWFAARGRWVWSAFFAGLALGIHHATVLMALPAALFLLWTARRPSVREFGRATAAGVLGLCIYLYLPIRALQHPLLNWGDPSSPQRFWWHITGKQYQAGLIEHGVKNLDLRIIEFFQLWISQVTPWGFAAVAGGLVFAAFRYRRTFWFTLLAIGFNLAFCWIVQLGGPDVAGYYLPVFFAISWCFALGAEGLSRLLARWGVQPAWTAAAVLAFAAVPAAVHFPANDHRRDTIAPLLIENIMRDVPPNSLIMSRDWNVVAPWMYRRFVEGYRPDVLVLDINMLPSSWYIDDLKREYPQFFADAPLELADFQSYVDRRERGDHTWAEPAAQSYLNLLKKMIASTKARGASVFCTLEMQPQISNLEPLSPHGVVYALSPALTDVELDVTGYFGSVPLDETGLHIRSGYSIMLTAAANRLEAAGDRRKAIEKLDLALKLDPEDDHAQRLRFGLSMPPPVLK